MAVTAKDPYAAGEDADASRYGSAGGVGGSAFSLGQSAYDGKSVYYGLTTRAAGGRGSGGRMGEGSASEQTPVWIKPSEAYQDYFTWTGSQRSDLRAKGILSGQLRETDGDMETAAWWKSLVQQAARYGAAGQQVSPMMLADGYLGASGYGMTDQERFKLQRGSFPAGAIFDSSGKYTRTYRDGQFVVNELTGQRTYVGPKFKTTTDTKVDFTDPATARALTSSIFQQLVGRDPGAGELGQFAAALQQAEQSAPVTTSTTSEFNSLGEVVSQSSKSSGGLTAAGREQLMKEKLQQTKEYGAFQAATTYANATKRAIWGGPGA